MKAQPISCIALLATLAASGTGAWAQNCGFGGFWNNDAAPLPAPRYEHTCAVVNGKIYVFGDYNHSDDNNSVLMYDPAKNIWTPPDGPDALELMPTGRGQAAAAEVDGIVYVFGGNNCFGNCWLTTNEGYDVKNDVWITGLAPMLGDLRGLLTATAVDGKIYVMGGVNSYFPPTYDYNHIYDPATDSWSEGPVLPHRRSHHAAVALDGKIYLIGGRYRLQHDEPIAVPEVDVFDPQAGENGEWSSVAPLPTARIELSAVTFNGKIYAIGGNELGPDGQTIGLVDIVEEYDPVLDCWRRVTPLLSARVRGCAAVAAAPLDTGTRRIYFIGGNVGGGPKGALDENLPGYPLPCPGDLDGDGNVGASDLLILLFNWGACVP